MRFARQARDSPRSHNAVEAIQKDRGSEPAMSANATAQTSAAPAQAAATRDGLLARCAELQEYEPGRIVAEALKTYSPDIGIAFSGAEDVVLIDMAAQSKYTFHVFMLDTGRLHPETYEFAERVREHYGVSIEIYVPDPASVQRLVREKGLFSFYRDGHSECCSIRKVEPLRRALGPLRAWITGQRRDQSPFTRSHVPVVQLDPTFATAEHPLLKVNPVAQWTSPQVWDYIRSHGVPYNSLHERGYISIGCQPCTRAILPGEHERAGRWWWEEATRKECGLHSGNLQSGNGDHSPAGAQR
jgi:phosphoadenosine phosphosulfate reductase